MKDEECMDEKRKMKEDLWVTRYCVSISPPKTSIPDLPRLRGQCSCRRTNDTTTIGQTVSDSTPQPAACETTDTQSSAELLQHRHARRGRVPKAARL